MTRHSLAPIGWVPILGTLVLAVASPAASEPAAGTVSYKGNSLVITYAFLVKGPDSVDPSKIVRRLIFSAQDLAARLKACQTMSCIDGEVKEGMTVDLDAGRRLNYWTALKGGLVQYSGTAIPSSLAAKSDEAGRVAGRLAIDDTAAGGPKVDVEFDATLLRELKAAR